MARGPAEPPGPPPAPTHPPRGAGPEAECQVRGRW